MSAELTCTLGMGIALGGLVIALQSRTNRRMDATAAELARFRGELQALGERPARLKRLIKGFGLFRTAAPAGDWPTPRRH